MTRDQFKKELSKRGYKWKEEGEWIIVEETDHVILDSLKSIPSNVQFNSRGHVYLQSLKLIPNNVQFNNSGDVHLTSVKSIPNNVQFRNSGYVFLNSLKSIPIDLDSEKIFKNGKVDITINDKWLALGKNISFPDYRWKSVGGRVQMYESWVKNNY